MALSRLTYNSFNVTPSASKAVGFGSGADDLSASLSGGSIVFIKKLTASSSATVSFVNGSSDVVLDGTYKEYLFTFKNIHAQTNDATFKFNGSDDTSSHSYDIAKTTSYFDAYQTESATIGFGYRTAEDLANGTGVQTVLRNLGVGNDQSASGYLYLYAPSDTTYVKHFIGGGATYGSSDENVNNFVGGYFNTTAAITAIQFAMSSGNIDAGDICLYGVN